MSGRASAPAERRGLKAAPYKSAAALLMLTALAASFLPARRASRVDPIIPLRTEETCLFGRACWEFSGDNLDDRGYSRSRRGNDDRA